MLREFARSKLYANDYWGGQKGAVTGPASPPPKIFSWMKRKMSGAKKPTENGVDVPEAGRRNHAVDGEIGRGEVSCSLCYDLRV